MKFRFKKIFMATLFVTLAPWQNLLAQGNPSDFNIGYTSYGVEDVDLGAISLRYHYDWNPYFGFDGEIGFGVSDDDFMGVTFEADFGYGLYLTGNAPIGNNGSDVFLRLGYASIDIEGSLAGISASDESDGFSWGVGTNMMFNPNHGIRLDYTDIDGDADTDYWSVSYVYSF